MKNYFLHPRTKVACYTAGGRFTAYVVLHNPVSSMVRVKRCVEGNELTLHRYQLRVIKKKEPPTPRTRWTIDRASRRHSNTLLNAPQLDVVKRVCETRGEKYKVTMWREVLEK